VFPAGAVVAVGTVSSETPHIGKLPNRSFSFGEGGNGEVVEVAIVEVMEVEKFCLLVRVVLRNVKAAEVVEIV
jgi:hypothetical protein